MTLVYIRRKIKVTLLFLKDEFATVRDHQRKGRKCLQARDLNVHVTLLNRRIEKNLEQDRNR